MIHPDLPEKMEFLLIVSDPGIARFVHDSGVARLFVDLEHIGKDQRQKGLDTWKSKQSPADVTRIREVVPEGHLLVRVNPLYDGTAAELDDVIARGADSVMLPMFQGTDDLARFLDLLNGRVEAVPLIETVAALKAAPEFSQRLPLTRVHIGLNDLHLDLKQDFIFQPLAEGMLDEAAAAFRANGVRFGIGGVARAGEGIVSPEYLLGEHVRLGSDAAILSRTLHRGAPDVATMKAEMDFPVELAKLQMIYARFREADAQTLEANRIATGERVRDVVTLIRNKRGN